MAKKFCAYISEWESNAQKDAYWAVLTNDSGFWSGDAFFQTGDLEIQTLWKHIEKHCLAISRKGKVLDFGCGTGRLSRAFAALFPKVVGVDISLAMIREAQATNASVKNLEFVHNPNPDLKVFFNDEFNFVYSNIVFQHIHPREQLNYLREFARVLAKGGWAVVQIPSKRVYASLFAKIKGKVAEYLPLWLKRKILKLLFKNNDRAVQEFAIEMNCIPEAVICREAYNAGLEIAHIAYTNSTDPKAPGNMAFISKEEAFSKLGYVSPMYFFRKSSK